MCVYTYIYIFMYNVSLSLSIHIYIYMYIVTRMSSLVTSCPPGVGRLSYVLATIINSYYY